MEWNGSTPKNLAWDISFFGVANWLEEMEF